VPALPSIDNVEDVAEWRIKAAKVIDFVGLYKGY
jgi:hypothetical protein